MPIGYVQLLAGVVAPLALDERAYYVPMTTTEGCLVASTNRGCKVITKSGGEVSVVLRDGMKRAPVVRFATAAKAVELKFFLEEPSNLDTLSVVFNSTSDYDKEKLQERLAKLSGGVAVLKIGGASETEVGKKKDKVTDALNTTKAALDEGIDPGGGVALLYASRELEKLQTANFDQKIGVQIIQNTLKTPVHTIDSKAGVEGSVVVGNLLEEDNLDLCYDAAKGEYIDMVKDDIIDLLKVIRTALVDAASLFVCSRMGQARQQPDHRTGPMDEHDRPPRPTWLGPDKRWRLVMGSLRKHRGLAVLYQCKDFIYWVKVKHPRHSIADNEYCILIINFVLWRKILVNNVLLLIIKFVP